MYKIKTLLTLLFAVMVSCSVSVSTEQSQWRGPDRDGKYPDTGLMKEWPEEGPELLWSYEGLGAGHGSAAVAGDRIFVLGMPDTMGVIYSFDMQGKLLWEKEYGLEWYRNYTGVRSTPTIEDGLLYFISGQGVVYCLETGNGEIRWSVDMFERFGAQETRWGIAESPLLDGDRIILTPGGQEHNVVALDRFTGELVWSARGNGDQSAYCSPILAEHNGTRLIFTMTSESILGIDAESGDTYWSIEQRQRHLIHANSPVYQDGKLYCASAHADTLNGLVMIQLSDDGKDAEVGWRSEDLLNLMGGIILHEGCIYGSTYRKKAFNCVDAFTGALNYVSDQVSDGAMIFAGESFYSYGTDGIFSLIEADASGCREISRFSVELGTAQHWAHPVIHNGCLYVRHGDALMCYDIAGKS